MTPLQLDILIHYKSAANDYRNGNFMAPAVREAIDWFCGEAGLLEGADKSADATYQLTQKGHVFVDYLCQLPLPVQVWVMPASAG